MAAVRIGADVAAALDELAEAARALANGAGREQALGGLARAAALGSGADAAVVWLPGAGGVVADNVWSSSAGLAAELEGVTAGSLEAATAIGCARLGEGSEAVAGTGRHRQRDAARSRSIGAAGRSSSARPGT